MPVLSKLSHKISAVSIGVPSSLGNVLELTNFRFYTEDYIVVNYQETL